MLKKIHHVGVVVRSADEALRFYRDALGLPVAKDAVIEDQGVRGILLPAGETEIELLEPIRAGTGVVRFLERGEGLHHVCFESDDVAAELANAKAKGLRLLDERPRAGLAGMIGFLHPSTGHGVLVEFATPPEGAQHHAGGAVVRGFDHLVLATKELDGSAADWSANFGFVESGRNELPGLGIKNVSLRVGTGSAFVELVTPLGSGGAVEKFLAERGEGMYLISLAVGDLDGAVKNLRASGGRVGDPVAGGSGNRIAFISPRSTHGVSIQLVQRGGAG